MLKQLKLLFKRIFTNKWTVPGVIIYSILAVLYWIYLAEWLNETYRWYLICPAIISWFWATGNREVFTWDRDSGYSRPDVTGELYHWCWRTAEQLAVALFILSINPVSLFDYLITLISVVLGFCVYEYKFVVRNER